MKNRISETQLLQNYGVLFQNIKRDTVLATELAEYGYDTDAVAIGEDLYNTCVEKYDTNKTETAEQTSAYAAFSQVFEDTKNSYSTDRKKAKIIFKNQPDVLQNLGIKGTMPQRNAALIDTMRLFYQTLDQTPELLTPLAKLKITAAHVTEQIGNVTQVESAYADYIQEKGESQQATKDKNKAFDDITHWVNELYSVAKIALEDKPQLLESIGKWVRS